MTYTTLLFRLAVEIMTKGIHITSIYFQQEDPGKADFFFFKVEELLIYENEEPHINEYFLFILRNLQ